MIVISIFRHSGERSYFCLHKTSHNKWNFITNYDVNKREYLLKYTIQSVHTYQAICKFFK